MNRKNETKRRIYLINPEGPSNFWNMESSVRAMGVKTPMPNIALATVAALTPKEYNVDFAYCDENVSKINFNKNVDLVALTGFKLHGDRIREIAQTFQKKGIPVALGGPFATLFSDMGKEIADFLFIGEAEYTWPQFIHDWYEGIPQSIYHQKEFIDMSKSMAPDYTMIKGSDYLYFNVQTSRGCPNDCDFCDIKRLVGRGYRSKSIDQIMVELENAHVAGAETIFFSEDNFFVNRAFTKELLERIIIWNTKLARPVSFSAQATIRIGSDEEILKLLSDARFSVLFLGVESIRKKCLDEINKGHIFKYDPFKSVSRISSYGILPFIGLIVGFDNDDKETFGEIKNFMKSTASPIASISVLNAPENTALYDRIKKAGRLIDDYKGVWHFSTNIVPISMPLDELLSNHRILFRSLYNPENFEKRLIEWLKNISYISEIYINQKLNPKKFLKFFYIIKYYCFHEPKDVRKMFFRILKMTFKMNPRLIRKAITVLSQYCHFYDFSMRELENFDIEMKSDSHMKILQKEASIK